jgi:hypothetical protein
LPLTRVSFGGVGETGSEKVTGTLQFDATTGTAFNIFLQGTRVISEYWAVASLQRTPGNEPWNTSLVGGYLFYDNNAIGSQVDILPDLFWMNQSGGDFHMTASGCCNVPGGGMDDWGIDSSIVPAPEPATWILILLGLVILTLKLKTLSE